MDLEQILAVISGDIDAHAAEIEDAADAKDPDAAPGPFAIAVASSDGAVLTAGAADAFPIQSIAKMFALDLALRAVEERVFERVEREPSGDPFNSLVDLERTGGLPRNPFINAGALVVVDMLVERHGVDARDLVIDLFRQEVGGGVLAVAPETASIAAWSPNLDQHGNSILAVRGIEMLVERTGWSVFGPPIVTA